MKMSVRLAAKQSVTHNVNISAVAVFYLLLQGVLEDLLPQGVPEDLLPQTLLGDLLPQGAPEVRGVRVALLLLMIHQSFHHLDVSPRHWISWCCHLGRLECHSSSGSAACRLQLEHPLENLHVLHHLEGVHQKLQKK